jgi:hypothetical protein
MQSQSNSNGLLLRILLIVAILSLVFFHLWYRMPGYDAGLHLYGSMLLTEGRIPYHHFWNNKPPLIYVIGLAGYWYPRDPFFGIRFFELLVLALDMLLIYRICKLVDLRQPFVYIFCFIVIYLLCWDRGFLTETFHIPLMLLAVYGWLKNTRYYEFYAAAFVFFSFMLKQNAGIITGLIVLADLATHHRPGKRSKKIARYALAMLVYTGLLAALLLVGGIFNEFVDQVFIYNSKYAERSSLLQLVKDHLFHNSFLSVKGVSLLLPFDLFVLIKFIQYLRQYRRKEPFSKSELLLACLSATYLLSYYFVYVSGKSYAHYFMLLIVPATMLLGYAIQKTLAGKLMILFLFGLAIWLNSRDMTNSSKRFNETKEAAAYIRTHTGKHALIHLRGNANHYLYVLADRFSNSSFIMPLTENNGYTDAYKSKIGLDWTVKPPVLLILNKMSNRPPDTANYYYRVFAQEQKDYRPVFSNELFEIYSMK